MWHGLRVFSRSFPSLSPSHLHRHQSLTSPPAFAASVIINYSTKVRRLDVTEERWFMFLFQQLGKAGSCSRGGSEGVGGGWVRGREGGEREGGESR